MSASTTSPAPADRRIYLIDTNVLAVIENRPDGPAIYSGLIEMARTGQVRTVRQVFDELKKFDSVHTLLNRHRQIFLVPLEQQFDPRVGEVIDKLGNEIPELWEQTGNRNPDPADPWLVAVGSIHQYTVVTNEKQRSPVKIPAACRLLGTRCIHGPHFLIEVGLVERMRPEDLDPAAFFPPKT